MTGPALWAPLSSPEILAAVPDGSRRARGQRDWLHALARDPDLAGLRADRQGSIRRVARVLMRYASWRDRTTRPTRSLVCALAGVAVSTWKAARRWLEGHGYLGTVRPGRRPWSRHVGLEADEPNEAAVYVLTVPRPRENREQGRIVAGHSETRPLTSSRREDVLSHARGNAVDNPGSDGGRSPVAVVRRLRAQLGVLSRGPARQLSDRHVLAIARPMLAGGWDPADLAAAVNGDPAGPHRYTLTTVRDPARWLAWRLSRWMRDPAGAWAGYQRLGRWDWSGDPGTWPAPALPPSARAVRRAAADKVRLGAVLEHGIPADPAAFASKIRERHGWGARHA